MKNALILLLLIVAFGGIAKSQTVKVVTAAQANGVYRDRGSEFRILALGHNKLKVQFNGEYMTRAGYPNIGEAMGEATIEGDVATFVPGETTGCKITIKFARNRIEVTQEGSDADCGFGHNVTADGTYRKIKSGKPKFIAIP
ncbi:MAG: hypothetical protein QOD75_3325 [Blastocatellia bacterium]|nr:hypothetical protein [Blastocatellia bacterium]